MKLLFDENLSPKLLVQIAYLFPDSENALLNGLARNLRPISVRDNNHMATGPLTLEQFHKQYGREPGWEFWFGKAVRKPVPTWYHCVLQILLGELLFRSGYVAGSELDLRIDPDWEPRPDVTAAVSITGRYPTKSSDVELVIEILSDDQMGTLVKKCEHYARIGISHIYVFDPEGRRIWKWNASIDDLERCVDVHLPNGTVLRYDDIWSEFERRLAPSAK